MASGDAIKNYDTDALSELAFPQHAIKDAAQIARLLAEPGTMHKVESFDKRMPTDAEFYCINVGAALTSLLSICKQLEQAVIYIRSSYPNKTMKSAGVNAYDDMLYCIENYILRTRTLFDRTLILVDWVFGLHNSPRKIDEQSVSNNMHVKRTAVPKKLIELKKVLHHYSQDRNMIAHEKSYRVEELNLLGMYTALDETGYHDEFPFLKENIRNQVRKLRKAHSCKFQNTNTQAFQSLGRLFEELHSQYKVVRNHHELVGGPIEALAK